MPEVQRSIHSAAEDPVLVEVHRLAKFGGGSQIRAISGGPKYKVYSALTVYIGFASYFGKMPFGLRVLELKAFVLGVTGFCNSQYTGQ